MFILYDIIFILFALMYFPYLLIKGKWHKDFLSRFGGFSKEIEERLCLKPNIWIHAVSVGEILVVLGLIDKIKERFVHYQIVCSTVTKTGYDLAQTKLPKDVIVVYAPFDLSLSVRRYIDLIKPRIYISSETEIWPNIYTALANNNIPVVLINGRISDKAYKGYKGVLVLTRKVLKCVQAFCMQSEMDASRVLSLGADSKKVHVVGNLKFDVDIDAEAISLKKLGFSSENKILLAGSTHQGEEEILIDIYKKLSAEFKDLRLMIAPRHPERAEGICQLVQKSGFHPIKFSKITVEKMNQDAIVVVDSIGQLRNLYSIAALVFVGKSFVKGGGQNMIEPVYFGKPTFVGPRTDNFKDVTRVLLKENVLVQVKDPEELLREMKAMLQNPQRQKAISQTGKQVLMSYRGATVRTLRIISDFLKD
ncbi:MAG: 3-deoxy-D-manno-octulosonic acid transferase [Candidatus Omnitrophica bacterium]|nr:3-deoxy-D-manno-octulosonic acid transferase [Candidatus Omnitrophota bacterium]